MKWFKHYTDNHRGQFQQALFQKFGHTGVACFYILKEMCAEKMELDEDGNLVTKFMFSEQLIRRNLHISPTNLRLLLDFCQTNVRLIHRFCETNSGLFIEFEMPNLLKLLNRDIKKPRTKRDKIAGNKRLDKEEEEDKDKNIKKIISVNLDLEILYKKYPKKVGKQKGLKKLSREIKTQTDFDNLSLAIDRYTSFLIANKTETQFVKQFDSFATVWKDYLEEDFGQSSDFAQKGAANTRGYVEHL